MTTLHVGRFVVRTLLTLLTCGAAWGQFSSINWTRNTIPGTCKDSSNCFWPVGQGFLQYSNDGYNGGISQFTTRQQVNGTVTVDVDGVTVHRVSGVAWDAATWGLSATGNDQVTIAGVNRFIVQGSVSANQLTISATTTASPVTPVTFVSGGFGITMSNSYYHWNVSSNASCSTSFVAGCHGYDVAPSGHLTISNLSGNAETDDPSGAIPADRQQGNMQFYDSTRNSMWLTGGVNGGKIWNCVNSVGVSCNAGFPGTFYLTMWRRRLDTGAWVNVPSTNHPIAGNGFNFSDIDTDNQIIMQMGFDGGANFRVAAFCPTDLNPTPGTMTAAQALVCSAADDWTPNVSGITGTSMPNIVQAHMHYMPSIHKFVIMFGAVGSTYQSAVYTFDDNTKAFATVAAGAGCPMPAPFSGATGGDPGVTKMTSSLLFYHWANTSTSQDWIYNASADTCTLITTTGQGPIGTVPFALGYDAGTSTVVAFYQSTTNNDVWEGTFPTPPAITTTSLPNGSTLASYAATITVTGAPTPTCSVTGGAAPTGLTLASCAFTGTPTVAGGYTFTVTATNGASPDATQAYSVNITGNGPSSTASGSVTMSGWIIKK